MSNAIGHEGHFKRSVNRGLTAQPFESQKEVMKTLLKCKFSSSTYLIEPNELPFNFVPKIQPKLGEYNLPSCIHLKNIDEDSKYYSDTEKSRRKKVKMYFNKRLSINEIELYKKALKIFAEENESPQNKQHIANVIINNKENKGTPKSGITILQKLKKVKMNHI
jgi:hypothetical protein